jgi:hypothetical protein
MRRRASIRCNRDVVEKRHAREPTTRQRRAVHRSGAPSPRASPAPRPPHETQWYVKMLVGVGCSAQQCCGIAMYSSNGRITTSHHTPRPRRLVNKRHAHTQPSIHGHEIRVHDIARLPALWIHSRRRDT